jgi:hypothetical protein
MPTHQCAEVNGIRLHYQGFRPLPLQLSKNGTSDTIGCKKKVLIIPVYISGVWSGLKPCLWGVATPFPFALLPI